MLKSIKRLIKNSIKRVVAHDSQYKIGSISITLPAGHTLPRFQKQFKLFDIQLAQIAKIIHAKDTDAIGIDIGANVGDTAAIIRSQSEMQLVCIEGHPVFFKYLQKNAPIIKKLTLINANAGFQEETIAGEMDKHGGTSAIVDSSKQVIEIKRLSTLLKIANVDSKNVKLIKIDTDGFDFDIILGSKDVISSSKPSLYFEYDFFEKDAVRKSIEVVEYLTSNGYKFVVYDNFGNFMTEISSNIENRFNELNRYLLSCRKYGGGIVYADVFATCDNQVYESVVEYEKGLVDEGDFKHMN